MNLDIVIVGAGTAGLFAARELEKDFNVAIFEKNSFIGSYGNRIVNSDVFKKLKVSEDCIINPIDSITFISPSGISIDVDRKNRGYVIDKEKVEKEIHGQLQNTKIFLISPVKSLNFERNKIKTGNGHSKFKFLLAADGAQSFIRSRISKEAPILIKCYYEVFKKGDEKTTCIISNTHTPGFYGWSIDMGDTVEIGIGSFEDPTNYFKGFVKSFFPKRCDVIKKRFGLLARSAIKKRVHGNCIFIGDSSGGEPLMGSSIHKAIDEAKLASEVILKGDSPKSYEELWKGRFSKEFEFENIARKKLDSMKDEEIDNFFRKKCELKSEGLVTGLFKDLINQ